MKRIIITRHGKTDSGNPNLHSESEERDLSRKLTNPKAASLVGETLNLPTSKNLLILHSGIPRAAHTVALMANIHPENGHEGLYDLNSREAAYNAIKSHLQTRFRQVIPETSSETTYTPENFLHKPELAFNYTADPTYSKEFLKHYKAKENPDVLVFLTEESDNLYQNLLSQNPNAEPLTPYTKMAANLAKVILEIIKNHHESSEYTEVLAGTHSINMESFLLKLLETQQGKPQMQSFLHSENGKYKNGFIGDNQYFTLNLENFSNTKTITLTFDQITPILTFTISEEELNTIANQQ